MKLNLKSRLILLFSTMILGVSLLSCEGSEPGGGEEPPLPPTPPTLEEKNDIIVFFDFNESGGLLVDYSGNNYHGKVNGIPGNGWVLGIKPNNMTTDRAVDFGYTNRYIEMSFAKSISKQFSISAWVRPLLLDGAETPMSIFESTREGGPNLAIRNDGAIIFSIRNEDDNATKLIAKSTPLQADVWQNISITYDGSSGKVEVYINGTLTDSGEIEKQDVVISEKSVIGGYGKNGFFDGVIDNLLLYGRILTSDEIEKFSNKLAPNKQAPTFTDYQTTLKNTWPEPTYNVPERSSFQMIETDFPANPIEKDGWELTKNDEFNGNKLDETLWIPYYLRQRASDSQALAEYEFRNGSLVLKISKNKEHYYSNTHRISSLQTAEGSNFHVQGSREIPKKITFAQQYGYFEIRAKTQVGSGNLCAFWLVGATDNANKNGEIDVFEQPGNAGPNSLLFNLYRWNDTSLTLPVDSKGWRNRLRTKSNLTSTFNIYGMEWDKDEIKLFLNNELVNIIPKSPAYQMAVLISLYEINGDWFGDIDHKISYPKEFAIDYFRVYKKK